MARRRRDKKGRSSVFQLNRGASTRGRYSRLSPNSQGGGFMSGRPAGGSPAAAGGGGGELLAALASPLMSVQGDFQQSDVPMQDNPVAPTPPSSQPKYPSFTPPPPPSVYSQPPIVHPSPINPIAIPPSLIPAPPPPPPTPRAQRMVPRAI